MMFISADNQQITFDVGAGELGSMGAAMEPYHRPGVDGFHWKNAGTRGHQAEVATMKTVANIELLRALQAQYYALKGKFVTVIMDTGGSYTKVIVNDIVMPMATRILNGKYIQTATWSLQRVGENANLM